MELRTALSSDVRTVQLRQPILHIEENEDEIRQEYYMTFVLSCSPDLTPIANYLDYHVLRHIPKDAIPFQLS